MSRTYVASFTGTSSISRVPLCSSAATVRRNAEKSSRIRSSSSVSSAVTVNVFLSSPVRGSTSVSDTDLTLFMKSRQSKISGLNLVSSPSSISGVKARSLSSDSAAIATSRSGKRNIVAPMTGNLSSR